jgi:hypothetical protein
VGELLAYSKKLLQYIAAFGFAVFCLGSLAAIVCIILKIVFGEEFSAVWLPALLAAAILGGLQIFLTGLIGEYFMNMNKRIGKKPLVVEERLINFDEK